LIISGNCLLLVVDLQQIAVAADEVLGKSPNSRTFAWEAGEHIRAGTTGFESASNIFAAAQLNINRINPDLRTNIGGFVGTSALKGIPLIVVIVYH
jgi:hypothetical protein